MVMGSGIASQRWPVMTDSVSIVLATRALVAAAVPSIAGRRVPPSWTPGRWAQHGVRCDEVAAWVQRMRMRARMTRAISWRTSWIIWRGYSSAACRQREDTRIRATSSEFFLGMKRRVSWSALVVSPDSGSVKINRRRRSP